MLFRSISKLIQYLKGKSSYKLLQENKQLSKEFWGRHLWGRGYFVATSGNVTDEVIMEYIKNQVHKNPTITASMGPSTMAKGNNITYLNLSSR